MFFAFHFYKQVSGLEFLYSFGVGSTGYYFFRSKKVTVDLILYLVMIQ